MSTEISVFQSTPLTRGETLRAWLRLPSQSSFQSTPLMRGVLRRKFFVTTCALFVTSFIQPKMQKPGLFMQTGFSSFMQLFGSLERQTASSVSPFSPGVLSSVWA